MASLLSVPSQVKASAWVLCNSWANRIFKRCLCSCDVTFWSFSVDKVNPTLISPLCLLDLPPSGFCSSYQRSMPDEGISCNMNFQVISQITNNSRKVFCSGQNDQFWINIFFPHFLNCCKFLVKLSVVLSFPILILVKNSQPKEKKCKKKRCEKIDRFRTEQDETKEDYL